MKIKYDFTGLTFEYENETSLHFSPTQLHELLLFVSDMYHERGRMVSERSRNEGEREKCEYTPPTIELENEG